MAAFLTFQIVPQMGILIQKMVLHMSGMVLMVLGKKIQHHFLKVKRGTGTSIKGIKVIIRDKRVSQEMLQQKGVKGDAGTKGDTGGGAPVGQIIAWSGAYNSLPSGYLICDGSAISRTTYAALFAVVGTSHGSGDGSTTFNLPDLQSKFITGASSDPNSSGYSVGAEGGANFVTLTTSQDAITQTRHKH